MSLDHKHIVSENLLLRVVRLQNPGGVFPKMDLMGILLLTARDTSKEITETVISVDFKCPFKNIWVGSCDKC